MNTSPLLLSSLTVAAHPSPNAMLYAVMLIISIILHWLGLGGLHQVVKVDLRAPVTTLVALYPPFLRPRNWRMLKFSIAETAL